MLTYPKSTMRVRRIPMHLSSGHMTLMPWKFPPPLNFPPVGLRAPGGLTLGFAQISSFFYLLHFLIFHFSETGHQTKTEIWGRMTVTWKESRPNLNKFHWGVLEHFTTFCNRWLDEQAAVDLQHWAASRYTMSQISSLQYIWLHVWWQGPESSSGGGVPSGTAAAAAGSGPQSWSSVTSGSRMPGRSVIPFLLCAHFPLLTGRFTSYLCQVWM